MNARAVARPAVRDRMNLTRRVVSEAVGTALLLAAVVGFKRNLWIVATGLVAHGLFDFVHGHVISNPGVPAWWPMFCFAYDVTAGVYLAWLLKSSRRIPL